MFGLDLEKVAEYNDSAREDGGITEAANGDEA